MSMSLKNQQALLRDGFLQSEVTQFNEAVYLDGTPQHINIESKTWLQARENRRNWIRMLQKHCVEKLGRRLSQMDINKLVTKWVTSQTDPTPFDFIRAEYKIPEGATPKLTTTGYQIARQKRAKSKTKKLYRKRTTKTQKRSTTRQGFEGKPYG